ncbi:MAG: alpha/beta hydrolase [Caldilineaceae bacterium]
MEVEHRVRYGINHWQRLYEFMCEMDFTPHSNHGDQLQRISCPTLVFSGDRDGIIPLDQVVEQFESIPDAELLIMPGTNHFTALKKTEWLTDAIVEFIERH